ncbi:hypothetical protein [Flavobacterium sp. 83]|jgi:hypothetical protein|uniref:hypothetical protein n=1 Tax=Flavobacterium sp. 83 TaxID=1131812 RepID=UPI000AE3622C
MKSRSSKGIIENLQSIEMPLHTENWFILIKIICLDDANINTFTKYQNQGYKGISRTETSISLDKTN